MDADELPKYIVGDTNCFRKESDSAGKIQEELLDYVNLEKLN